MGQECAPDCAFWLLPWAWPSNAQRLDWEGGRSGSVLRGQGICWEEGTQRSEVDWLGESQLDEIDNSC